MKKLFFILLVLTSPLIKAECNRKIDPKQVIIFVDTNTSAPEIVKAEAGACARGQRLVIIPKNHKEYDLLFQSSKQIAQQLNNCRSKKSLNNNCSHLEKKENEISEKINNFRYASLNYSALLNDQLKELKKSNSSAVSFIISGHDGGGHFGGEKGRIGRDEIDKVFKDYPEVNKVKSALLLGCYTGVKFEVKQWASTFPDLHLLGGYDSTAPLSERPAGQQYVQELLLSENKLVEKSDQKKLEKKLFSSIKSLKELRAGIYIKPICSSKSDNEAFYYGSQNSDRGLEVLDFAECSKPEVIKDISEMTPLFEKYYSGELEPPADTTNGELRQIYNKTRRYEHCLDDNRSPITSSSVFNLLFYNGIKESFSDFYKDDLNKAEDILKNLNLDDVIKNQEKMLQDMEEQNNLLKSENEKLTNSPELYIEENNKIFDEDSKKYDQLLNDPAYASVLEQMPHLKKKFTIELRSYLDFNYRTPEEELKAKELSDLQEKIAQLSYKIGAAKAFPAQVISQNNYMINNYEYQISRISNKLTEYKKNPSILQNIWVPTAQNLKNKSRKEIMINNHKIFDLASTPGFPPKINATLSWMGNVTNSHLVYLQNPFSWHEHTARVEAPPHPTRLQPFLDNAKNYSNMQGAGFAGGMLGGGGWPTGGIGF